MEVKLSPLDELKAYAKTSLQLAKYEAIEKALAVVADVVAELLLFFCLLISVVVGSVALADYLANVLRSDSAGFGCVACLYLLLAVLAIFFKKRLESYLVSRILKKLSL
jgi:hypothetical protein